MEDSPPVQPSRPTNMPAYAEECLQALVVSQLNDKITLGGGLGLLHYLDYRPTHDVDAWWVGSTTTPEKERVIGVIAGALAPHGQVQQRAWGDVVSIELIQGGETVFSFQIANRSVPLQPPVPAKWIDISLDSLPDLVASKMVALVERGAPRDFRDIYSVCEAELVTPGQCWQLWQARQQRAGSDSDSARARLALETHLTRIALHRPLENIADPDQKQASQQLRDWFSQEFLNALLD